MRLLEEAGLPPGVINMVTGHGKDVSDVVMADPDLAGIHFTGSTPVFQGLWRRSGRTSRRYQSYPRIVGETGGKDFIVAHPSADIDVLRTAMIRGAFEYQGQKCSAASRAYVPRSIWTELRDQIAAETDAIAMGDVTDLSNFMGAVIDERAFAKHKKALDRARDDRSITVIAGGTYDDAQGWFVRPTVLESTDPTNEIFTTEYFGPILGVHVYDDDDYDAMLTQMESVAPYALTGAVIAQDRAAIAARQRGRCASPPATSTSTTSRPAPSSVSSRSAAPARAAPTTRPAAPQNLMRWTSTRSIKETFVPPTDYRYPHMG